MSTNKPGRNDPCPCGSGKKYKKCCSAQEEASAPKAQSANSSTDSAIQAALAHHRAGRLPQAQAIYQQVLEMDPRHPVALHLLGGVAYKTGKNELAVELIRKAISIKPNSSMYCDLGSALRAQKKLDGAVESYRHALALNPADADAHNNLGAALYAQGKLDEASAHYSKAISLDPVFFEAMLNLGIALKAQGKPSAAIECYRKAITLKPDFAEAFNGMGLAMQEQGRLNEAIGCYHRALELKPNLVEAHNNLGLALQDQGNPETAIGHYRHALRLKPDYFEAHSNLLFNLSYQSSPTEYFAEALRYGSKVLERVKPYTCWLNDFADVPRLRVGLVSGDLRAHPVGYFLENILAHLSSSRIELVAYSTNPQEDALTARIKPSFIAWHSIVGLSDEAAALKIHEDGIHILIDLAGHLAHNRLPVFAWKPAPVQANWLGYFASTGVPGVDYLLADHASVPESQREHFTETVWYLPDTRLCFTPPAPGTELDIKPLPAVRNGHITFGCFQRLFKINDGVLAVWGRLFRALPQARLRLQNVQMSCPVAREHLLRRLAASGIQTERVTIVEPARRDDYFEAHSEVDIILDTFPYTGGTTTCEALWMGVPTLTLAGDTLLARQGASMLACAGLEDWIASDEGDYVDRALAHAADVTRLSELRLRLREQVRASPLFDAPRFARHLEDALHGMWQQKMKDQLSNDH